jgi:hypothetical protein
MIAAKGRSGKPVLSGCNAALISEFRHFLQALNLPLTASAISLPRIQEDQ